MITTTKQEIRKAVIEALETESGSEGKPDKVKFAYSIDYNDFPSVADRVAETLGGEG